MDPAIEARDVVKAHGGLRPLRLRDLQVARGDIVALQGPDAVQAAVIIDLLTGTTLPDSGEVRIAGRSTRDLPDQEAWLAFLDQFGIVNDRVVLLDGFSVAQNLAVPLTLSIDPMAADIRERVARLSAEVGLAEALHDQRVSDASKLTRALVRLARALALDPEILLIEHPSSDLDPAEVRSFASVAGHIAARRNLTVFAVASDSAFADYVGARPLSWRGATGQVRSAGTLRRWLGR